VQLAKSALNGEHLSQTSQRYSSCGERMRSKSCPPLHFVYPPPGAQAVFFAPTLAFLAFFLPLSLAISALLPALLPAASAAAFASGRPCERERERKRERIL